MHSSHPRFTRALGTLAVAAALAALPGCFSGTEGGSALGPQVSVTADAKAGPECVGRSAARPPAGLVTTSFQGQSLALWPFTDRTFDGAGEDPVNLIFTGQADPRRIRAALLALDGDRTAYGFPNVYPFNARWTDANGDAMIAYSGSEGWAGSVVQLMLGNYAPVRAHLRLFRSGTRFGRDGTWTVGSAHFEVMIPGTADHQVLSWELAEQLVTVDLMRTGLLSPTAPMGSTGAINPAPGYRTIPAIIYNGLPAELVAVIQGPPQPAAADVPIGTDGRATILNLEKAAPLACDPRTEDVTFTYQQVIPKPICNASGANWVLVEGPVTFRKTARVAHNGAYSFHSGYYGKLRITPVDLSSGSPVPVGAPYDAVVSQSQEGFLGDQGGELVCDTKRIAPQPGGTEFLVSFLKVATHGQKTVRSQSHCNP
jgi:hypothetical protein